jgi:hypothetical protein
MNVPKLVRYFVFRIVKREIISHLFAKWDDAQALKVQKNKAAHGYIYEIGVANYENGHLKSTTPGNLCVPKILPKDN